MNKSFFNFPFFKKRFAYLNHVNLGIPQKSTHFWNNLFLKSTQFCWPLGLLKNTFFFLVKSSFFANVTQFRRSLGPGSTKSHTFFREIIYQFDAISPISWLGSSKINFFRKILFQLDAILLISWLGSSKIHFFREITSIRCNFADLLVRLLKFLFLRETIMLATSSGGSIPQKRWFCNLRRVFTPWKVFDQLKNHSNSISFFKRNVVFTQYFRPLSLDCWNLIFTKFFRPNPQSEASLALWDLVTSFSRNFFGQLLTK